MAPSTVIDAMAALAKAGAVVDLDDDLRLLVDARRPLEDRTAYLARRHRVHLAWAVVGRRGGHEWLVCDRCHEPQLLDPDKVGRLCHLTPGCKGKIQRPPRRLIDPAVAGWRAGIARTS